MEHFDPELFDYVRKRVGIKNNKHIWLSMSNEELLSSARLKLIDIQTGVEGYYLFTLLSNR